VPSSTSAEQSPKNLRSLDLAASVGRMKQTKQKCPPGEVSLTYLPTRLHCNPGITQIQAHQREPQETAKGSDMKRYKLSTPRARLGLTAVAMAAITMSAMVVLPAEFDSVRADPYALAAAKTATKAPVEVAVSPARTDIPEVANHEGVRAGRADLGTQQFLGKRYNSGSRRRADT
jgi:hypothetical protein